MPPTPRTAALRTPIDALRAPPPPTDIEPVEDPEKEERALTILELLSGGMAEKNVIKQLVRGYAITPSQARAEYDEALVQLQKRLDDEGAINAVHAAALARIQVLGRKFYDLASVPVPERVLETYGPDPDVPTDAALYRPLTQQEFAVAVGARAQAAKVALDAFERMAKIAGRRSTRWADKPALIAITAGVEGLSDADRKLLESLGMRG